jgi:hypothetical protein
VVCASLRVLGPNVATVARAFWAKPVIAADEAVWIRMLPGTPVPVLWEPVRVQSAPAALLVPATTD